MGLTARYREQTWCVFVYAQVAVVADDKRSSLLAAIDAGNKSKQVKPLHNEESPYLGICRRKIIKLKRL